VFGIALPRHGPNGFDKYARIHESYILRYDSPVDHRPFHHKHVFDPFRAGVELRVEQFDDMDMTPTLGDVIKELQDWYWEHEVEIAALEYG